MDTQSRENQAHEGTRDANFKRIIICFDGTFDDTGDTPERTKPGSTVSRFCRWVLPPLLWQILWVLRVFAVFKWLEKDLLGLGSTSREKSVTNASLLASAIFPKGYCTDPDGNRQHVHQITFYIGGIGGLGNPQSRVEEAVTGNTMTYKVRYAYRLLVDNYCPGDEVFLFGFSRGAFAARAIAEFIHYCGIFEKSAMADFDHVWAGFTKSDHANRSSATGQNVSPSGERREPKGSQGLKDITIRCVGVWDTVGSLGPPPLFFMQGDEQSTAHAAYKRHGHFDIGLKPSSDYAFHALALDERRFDFYPAVWYVPDNEQHPERYCQTWFSGVHTDTGGGNLGGLSQYALIWMISKIQENDLLHLDDEFVEANIIECIKNSCPPWDQAIRGRDYIELLLPWIGFLPRCIKDRLRTAHRNPYISVASTDGVQHDAPLRTKSKLHWSVVDRTKNSNGKYWASCPTLRKRDPATSRGPQEKDVQERMENPIGKDLELMQHFSRQGSSS